MLNDSIDLIEGSSIRNLVVESGSSFPTNPTVGEMFYYTVDSLMYVSNGVNWTSTGTGAGGGGGGSVSSVAISGSNGITVGGSPITNAGTFSLGLGDITPTSVTALGQIAGANLSGDNTGDETLSSIKSKLGITTLSGSNTGDETDNSIKTALGITTLSGSNTGDETAASIKAALGVTELSGENTGDETAVSIKAALGVTTLSGSNTGDQTITLIGDLEGSGTDTINVTLADVNLSPINLGFHKVTVNAKGLVTGSAAVDSTDITTVLGFAPYPASNPAGYVTSVDPAPVTSVAGRIGDIVLSKADVGLGSVDNTSDLSKPISTATSAAIDAKQDSLGFTPANKAGDTFTGPVLLQANPSQALGAATKQYVDLLAAGLKAQESVETATEAPLPASSYDNGVLGVGATLTASANGSLGAVGGYSGYSTNSRILVKDQVAAAQNGLYKVTTAGSAGTPWVLTRTTDYDSTAEIVSGDFTYVRYGTLSGTQWVMTTGGSITVGGTTILWTQLSGGASSPVAGAGINVTGNTVSNTGVLSVIAGSNIAVSGATGNVTLSVSGSVPLATNISGGAAGRVLYQSATGTTAFSGAGTVGQILTSNGSGAPTWVDNTGGSAETLSGTTINSSVVNSSLQTLGLLKSVGLSQFSTVQPDSTGIWYDTGFTIKINGAGFKINTGGAGNLLFINPINGLATFSNNVQALTFVGNLSGNATTATTATTATSATTATTATKSTHLAGGVAGKIPYQSAANTTSFTTVGNVGDVLTSNGSGAPTWEPGATVDANMLIGTTLANTVINSSLQTLGVVKGISFSQSGAIEPSDTGLWYNTGLTINVNGNGLKVDSTTTNLLHINPLNARATFAYNVHAPTFVGNLTGNATSANTATNATNCTNATTSQTATYLLGGGAGRIPYQANTNITSFLSNGTTGQFLKSNGFGVPPAWSSIDLATRANGLIGGTGGRVVYQSAADTTNFVAVGTAGQVLLSNGNAAPYWGTVSTVENANRIVGGTSGNVLYQSTAGTTQFVTNGSAGQVLTSNGAFAPSWNTLPVQTTVANIAGGTNGNLVYQSNANATSFVPNGTSGQILQCNGNTAPTWVNNTAGAFTLGDVAVTSGSTITTVTGVATLGFRISGASAPPAGYPGLWVSGNKLNILGTGAGFAFRNNANSATLLDLNDSGAAVFASSVTASSFSGSGSGLTSIPNSALTGSGVITIGSSQVALGGTMSSLTGITTMSGLSSVTSTNFYGTLTGSCTGSAASVTSASQPAITSVGTLTSLTVGPGTINGTLNGTCTGSASTVSNAAQPTITSLGTLTALNCSGTAAFTGTTTVGGFEVGTKVIPQNSKSVDYTTVLADSGKHILHPSADTASRTYVIDSNANVPYPIGTALTFINQYSAGVITISIVSDTMRLAVTGAVGNRSLAPCGIATAIKLTATEWIISGSGLS